MVRPQIRRRKGALGRADLVSSTGAGEDVGARLTLLCGAVQPRLLPFPCLTLSC